MYTEAQDSNPWFLHLALRRSKAGWENYISQQAPQTRASPVGPSAVRTDLPAPRPGIGEPRPLEDCPAGGVGFWGTSRSEATLVWEVSVSAGQSGVWSRRLKKGV